MAESSKSACSSLSIKYLGARHESNVFPTKETVFDQTTD